MVLVDARARCGPRPLKKLQILQEKRHAGERAIRKSLVDLPLGIIVVLDDDRIDFRIYFSGPRNCFIQQFTGADLPFSDEFGQTDGVIAAIFSEGHGHVPRG